MLLLLPRPLLPWSADSNGLVRAGSRDVSEDDGEKLTLRRSAGSVTKAVSNPALEEVEIRMPAGTPRPAPDKADACWGLARRGAVGSMRTRRRPG